MPLDLAQKILLKLAGTVAIPAPPPSGVMVEILPPIANGNAPEETYLRLTQFISLSVMIKWTVRLRNVSAVAAPRDSFPPDSPAEPWPVGDGWTIRTSEEVDRLVLKKIAVAWSGAGEPILWLTDAVIFVPESTPVLRQAEAGLTAAESVEYFQSPASVHPGFGSGPCDKKPVQPNEFHPIQPRDRQCSPMLRGGRVCEKPAV